MFSRIFWIGATAIALVAGLAWQGAFSWDHDPHRSADKRIEARIDREIDRGFDRMQVVGEDGEAIDVPRETRQAFANAVRRLVKAETELAMLRIRDGSDRKIGDAEARRDAAKADLDKLKEQIEEQKALTETGRDDLSEQIRADVHESVREAVRN